MSRIESAIQPSPRNDSWISHQLQHIPCGRCCAVIEYGRGTEWSVVSELVNAHWHACPKKPHEMAACMADTPSFVSDVEIVLPPPAPLEPVCSAHPIEQSAQTNTTWISVGCERKRRTLEQRKTELEQDEYAKNVQTKSVICGGCHKEISLDKRSLYYPGLWLKHKGKCPSIEKLERAKAMVLDTQNDGSSDRTPPGARFALHDDSGYQSSDTEEEREDQLPQEPFSILNDRFYWAQRQQKRAQWTYRYATKEEIDTNLFRGQDVSYTAVESRPLLWGGYYKEAQRCRFQVPTASSGQATWS